MRITITDEQARIIVAALDHRYGGPEQPRPIVVKDLRDRLATRAGPPEKSMADEDGDRMHDLDQYRDEYDDQ